MKALTAYEHDVLVADTGFKQQGAVKAVPKGFFAWLEAEALRLSENGETAWLRLTQCNGLRALRLLNYVGVVRGPDGTQLEILPKIGHSQSQATESLRLLLIEMLRSLAGFRFLQIDSAAIATAKMPLLEIFIGEFLAALEHLVKRGIRSDYILYQGNLPHLRGKMLMAQHLRHNVIRKERFYVEYDEYSANRPVNRLLVLALNIVSGWTKSFHNQKRVRELSFIFSDIPHSQSVIDDLNRMRTDRGMSHYQNAVAWMLLILGGVSPLVASGNHSTFSLLFPMEAVFEAYVGKHLGKQLLKPYRIRQQTSSFSLIKHKQNNWFRMRPDFLVEKGHRSKLVLDAKWKLLDSTLNDGRNKYGLSQNDFYQLFAYGKSYLLGQGDLILIYPKSKRFAKPLPLFEFSDATSLRLWVLPFCLSAKKLLLPKCGSLDAYWET